MHVGKSKERDHSQVVAPNKLCVFHSRVDLNQFFASLMWQHGVVIGVRLGLVELGPPLSLEIHWASLGQSLSLSNVPCRIC